MSTETIEVLVMSLSKDGELGKLVSGFDSNPWETKKKIKITHSDFLAVFDIVRSNMLYIPTVELSANAKNQVKRLAAFKNPDFYRAQAMRLPIYDKSQIICTADITEDYIAIPRGCEDALCDLLDDAGVVTRPPEDFKERERDIVTECAEKLRENGVTVKYRSDFHQKFAVIDRSLVWYGSVNFLSFSTHEESIMRFENTDIAGQLMGTVL